MALGKNTTIGKVEDIVRSKTGTVDNDKLTPTMALDIVNYNVSELAKKLSLFNAPFYMSTEVLSFSGDSAAISGISVDKIVKVVDSSLGIFTYRTPDDFERIGGFTNLYTNSLFYTVEGETIRRTKGSGLGAYATGTLYYFRNATHGASRSAFPDLPDSYTAILIKSSCNDVYGFLGKRSPELDQEISRDLEEIKAGFSA